MLNADQHCLSTIRRDKYINESGTNTTIGAKPQITMVLIRHEEMKKSTKVAQTPRSDQNNILLDTIPKCTPTASPTDASQIKNIYINIDMYTCELTC